MDYVKIWGLKRSGTNYLRWFIENNFENTTALMDVLGWKHGPPQAHPSQNWRDWYPEWRPQQSPVTSFELANLWAAHCERQVKHVAIVKDVYAWIDSITRFHKTKISHLSEYELERLVHHWNGMLNSYYDFGRKHPISLIVYESLISDPAMVVRELQEDGLTPKGATAALNLRCERGNDSQPVEACTVSDEIDRDYYLKQEYLENFSFEQRLIVEKTVTGRYFNDLDYPGFWDSRRTMAGDGGSDDLVPHREST